MKVAKSQNHAAGLLAIKQDGWFSESASSLTRCIYYYNCTFKSRIEVNLAGLKTNCTPGIYDFFYTSLIIQQKLRIKTTFCHFPCPRSCVGIKHVQRKSWWDSVTFRQHQTLRNQHHLHVNFLHASLLIQLLSWSCISNWMPPVSNKETEHVFQCLVVQVCHF